MLAPRVLPMTRLRKRSTPLGFISRAKSRGLSLVQGVQRAIGDISVFLHVPTTALLWAVLPSSACSLSSLCHLSSPLAHPHTLEGCCCGSEQEPGAGNPWGLPRAAMGAEPNWRGRHQEKPCGERESFLSSTKSKLFPSS